MEYTRLHVNHKPIVSLVKKDTTPGQPVTLEAEIRDYDNGNEGFTYQWSLPDYGGDQDSFNLGHPAPEVRLYHTAVTDQSSAYAVGLMVTDRDGGSAIAGNEIDVFNTKSGMVYADQYWSGSHELEGDVYVPPAVVVTVTEGSRVTVRGNTEPITEYSESDDEWAEVLFAHQYGIKVDGTLNLETGVTLEIAPGYDSWEGILVNLGTLNMTGVSVKNAYRGVTVNPAGSAVIEGSLFDGNYIGLHILKDGQVINDCQMIDNTYIGIKEEPGVYPVIIDTLFQGSKINYYGQEQPDMSIELLNLRVGNSGNREE